MERANRRTLSYCVALLSDRRVALTSLMAMVPRPFDRPEPNTEYSKLYHFKYSSIDTLYLPGTSCFLAYNCGLVCLVQNFLVVRCRCTRLTFEVEQS